MRRTISTTSRTSRSRLARHIVEQKSSHFDPSKFEDHYETALQDLLQKKQAGQPIEKLASRTSGNVIDIMDALRASLKQGGKSTPATKAPKTPARKPAEGKAAAKRKAG
jgi:DNA end-binding protein Ku